MEVLLEQQEEEGVVVNNGDTNDWAYKVVKDLNSSKNPIFQMTKGKVDCTKGFLTFPGGIEV